MGSPDFTSPDERNKQFVMNNALQIFNEMMENEEILFKDLKFPPNVKAYAENLLDCCRENTLCKEAISIFYFSAFVDAFNFAINIRIGKL